MQAAFPLRRSSFRPVVIALAIAAAVIVSVVAGYWLKSVTSPAAATVTVTATSGTTTGGATGGTASGRATDAIPVQKGTTYHGRALY